MGQVEVFATGYAISGSGKQHWSSLGGVPAIKLLHFGKSSLKWMLLERVYAGCPKPSSLRRQQLIRECPVPDQSLSVTTSFVAEGIDESKDCESLDKVSTLDCENTKLIPKKDLDEKTYGSESTKNSLEIAFKLSAELVTNQALFPGDSELQQLLPIFRQFECGNKHCNQKDGLSSYEVNFSYFEAGENKQALVKLVACERCAAKLYYKKRKEEERLRQKENGEHHKKRNRSESDEDNGSDYGRIKESRKDCWELQTKTFGLHIVD
ncbi:hypothetical protein CASFOL_023238 [Castilleja foliolosa]|uniref:Uncharacterized protein n=1 Tax=Castilleja foliolosa TaxID=1961234 RepID=A0ABD3CL50_9LAMI